MPKNVKGFWAFLASVCCKSSKKIEGVTLWRHSKLYEKSLPVPQKIEMDHSISSGFVSYIKKEK